MSDVTQCSRENQDDEDPKMASSKTKRRRTRKRHQKQREAEANKVYAVNCDYCGQPAELTTGEVIYPHRPDLYDKEFWRCEPCGAYVGCHQNTHKPFGRLANTTLRKLKIQAHNAFDKLWSGGEMDRNEAYHWLADRLGISTQECHIGMFDEETCRKTVVVCKTTTKE